MKRALVLICLSAVVAAAGIATAIRLPVGVRNVQSAFAEPLDDTPVCAGDPSRSPGYPCFKSGLTTAGVNCRTEYGRCIVNPIQGPSALCVDPFPGQWRSQWGMRPVTIPAAGPGPYNGTAYFRFELPQYYPVAQTQNINFEFGVIPSLPDAPLKGAFRIGISTGAEMPSANHSCVNQRWPRVIANGPPGTPNIATIELPSTDKLFCKIKPCGYNLVVENSEPVPALAMVYVHPYIRPIWATSKTSPPNQVYSFPNTTGWGGGAMRNYAYAPVTSDIAAYNQVTFSIVFDEFRYNKSTITMNLHSYSWGSRSEFAQAKVNFEQRSGVVVLKRGDPNWCEVPSPSRPYVQGCYYRIRLSSAYGGTATPSILFS